MWSPTPNGSRQTQQRAAHGVYDPVSGHKHLRACRLDNARSQGASIFLLERLLGLKERSVLVSCTEVRQVEVNNIGMQTGEFGLHAQVRAVEVKSVEIGREPDTRGSAQDNKIFVHTLNPRRQYTSADIRAVGVGNADGKLAETDTACIAGDGPNADLSGSIL